MFLRRQPVPVCFFYIIQCFLQNPQSETAQTTFFWNDFTAPCLFAAGTSRTWTASKPRVDLVTLWAPPAPMLANTYRGIERASEPCAQKPFRPTTSALRPLESSLLGRYKQFFARGFGDMIERAQGTPRGAMIISMALGRDRHMATSKGSSHCAKHRKGSASQGESHTRKTHC